MAVAIGDVTHRWELENDLTDSIGGKILTANGAVFENGSPLFGVASGRTDGINDSYFHNHDIAFDPESGSFSVEIWFKPDLVISSTEYLIAKGLDSSGVIGWAITLFASQINVRVKGPGGVEKSQKFPLTHTTNLQQLILSIDRTSEIIKGYYNGSNSGWSAGSGGDDTTGIGSVTIAQALRIGARSIGNDLNYDGLVDKIRIYKGYAIDNADAVILNNGGAGYDFGIGRLSRYHSLSGLGGQGQMTWNPLG